MSNTLRSLSPNEGKSWFQNEIRKVLDVECIKFGHRIYIVKIVRGAVIGRAASPWSAYVKAHQFLENNHEQYFAQLKPPSAHGEQH